MTDGEGIARFSAAPAGVFTLCARGARHGEFCEVDVGLVAGGTVSSTLLLPPGASIRGQFLHSDGSPAVGVRLMAVSGESDPWPRMPTQAVTDFLGNYHLDGVTPGWSNIYLFAPVVFPFSTEGQYTNRVVETVGEMDAQLDLRLGDFVHVSVKPQLRHVRGGAFNPSVSSVSMESVWGSIPLELREDGSWTGRVEAGVHVAEVLASSKGTHFDVERAVSLTSEWSVVIPVKHVSFVPETKEDPGWWPGSGGATEYFELAGHVFLPDGRPASGVRITIRQSGGPTRCGNGPFVHRHARFEGSGFAVKVPTYQRFVEAWLDNGYAGSRTISGRAGERVVADIQLEEAGAVAGRVGFIPSPTYLQAPYFSFGDGEYHLLKHVAEDGRFVVAGIPPGRYSMRVEQSSKTYQFDVQAGVATELGYLPLDQLER
ncbi:hypothetical protein [Myxococcus stipitatus]|nr:hypothetical protein [Myxococcus stipitatus]